MKFWSSTSEEKKNESQIQVTHAIKIFLAASLKKEIGEINFSN
jgi:hypothetical protein